MGLHDPVNTDDDISVFNVSKKKRAVVKKKNKDVGRAINLEGWTREDYEKQMMGGDFENPIESDEEEDEDSPFKINIPTTKNKKDYNTTSDDDTTKSDLVHGLSDDEEEEDFSDELSDADSLFSDDDGDYLPKKQKNGKPDKSKNKTKNNLGGNLSEKELKNIDDRITKCLKELEPLNHGLNCLDEMDPDRDQLERMLISYEKLWHPTSLEGETEVTVHELVRIVERCANINQNHNRSMGEIERLMYNTLLMPTHLLMYKFNSAQMIYNPAFEKSNDFERRFQRLFMMQSYAAEFYFNLLMFHYRAKNPILDYTPCSIGFLKYVPRTESDEYSDNLKILTHCLLELQKLRCRRFQSGVYQPIFTKDGYFTNAYKFSCSIEEFVWSCGNVDTQHDLYQSMYSKGANIPKQTIEVLKYIKSAYFPDLQPNRYLSSWLNGIYDVGEDKFYHYADNPYTKGFNNKNNKSKDNDKDDTPENIKDVTDKLKSLGKELPKFKGVFDSILVNLTEGENNKTKNDKVSSDNEFESGGLSSSIFIEQNFVELDNIRYENDEGVPINGAYKKLQTPAFETILDSQEFDEETKGWIYALLGRGLYYCGHMNNENWQIVLILLGYSGTGKSTILKYLRKFFNTENVGIISNNIERQWAMSSLVNKQIVFGMEVKKDFKWDHAEFQQCAACEELLVAVKRQQAFVTKFNSPIYLAANEMIKCWKDNSGALKRRLVVVPFRHFISPNNVDPHLEEKLDQEFSIWIQKINKAYREKTRLYARDDIWLHLPKIFQDASKQAMQSIHELQHFFQHMSENGTIIFQNSEDPVYCREDEFMKRFKEFCETKLAGAKNIRWHDDYWRPVFETQGLTMVTGDPIDPKLPGKTSYIKGMAFNAD